MKHAILCKKSTENAREYAVTCPQTKFVGILDVSLVMALTCLWKVSMEKKYWHINIGSSL